MRFAQNDAVSVRAPAHARRPIDPARFGYRISKTAAGWSWATFDAGGAVDQQGLVETRALAAACVIRVLAGAAVLFRM